MVGQSKAKRNKPMWSIFDVVTVNSEVPQNSVLGYCWFACLLLTWKWNDQLLADGIT